MASTGIDALFISRGDEVCRQTNAAIKPVSVQVTVEASKSAPDRPRLAALARRVQLLTQQGVARLRALRPPPQRAGEVGAFVQSAARLGPLLGSYAELIARNDGAGMLAMTKRLAAAKAGERAIARRIGFHVCGPSAA